MRIVIIEGQSQKTLSIEHQTENTTLREILNKAHIDLRHWDTVWVNDLHTTLDTPLREIALFEGAALSPTRLHHHPTSTWILSISGGLEAGETYEISPDFPTRIGRSPEAEITLNSPSVSWSHCAIRIENGQPRIFDTNSSNGTFVNGKRIDNEDGYLANAPVHITVGGTTLYLSHTTNDTETTVPLPHSSAALTPSSTIPFNRPPRNAGPRTPEAIELPTKKEPPKPNKFSWVAVLAPLLMAALMVTVMGSIRFAFIALLSPLIAIGSWAEQKRRAKISEKEENERYNAELVTLQATINDAAEQQRTHLQHHAPDVAATYKRAQFGSTKIWQRRTQSDDFLLVRLGEGNIPFPIPTHHSQKNIKKTDELQEILDSATIHAAPITVDLQDGPIGLWGQRTDCLAVARSLLTQIATHTGPADLSIGVFTDTPRRHDWTWTSWLPHLRMSTPESSFQLLGLSSETSTQILRNLRDTTDMSSSQALLLLIDAPKLLEGRDAPARDLLNRFTQGTERLATSEHATITGIIIADSLEKLPASCHSVVHVQHDANLTLSYPSEGTEVTDIIGSGISRDRAEQWARALARFDDPETKNHSVALPSLSHLLTLLDLESPTADALLSSWKKHNDFTTPVGIGENGVYTLNLIKDGPHGLVGGTTGSGKSEFLRSLVAGLASRVDPEHLNFILIDFKGGAAFAACDQLPHTIGTVSNLDEHLAKRAIQALQAEMKYRQEKFAAAGENIDSLAAYLKTQPSEPMPRILVVIDEFKELATTYPDVLSSLVSVAAVGRTLGVHLILATQRPDGIVSDDILANTNLRVALRVQDRSDSTNVIGVPYASSIGRNQQGRAYIKLGEDDIAPIQTALVTGHCLDSQSHDLSVVEIELGTAFQHERLRVDNDSDSDLDRLIQAISDASEVAGFLPPRPVWPEPLADRIPLILTGDSASDPGHAGVVSEGQHPLLVALSDAPERQAQYSSGWAFRDGNLLLFGMPGSGTTTALSSLIVRVADVFDPDECDVLILDFGTRELEVFSTLAHTGAYVPPGAQNRELHERFLKYVVSAFHQRTQAKGVYKPLFVFVDGLNTLRDDFRDGLAGGLLESFYQVWEKGADVGIHCVATCSRLKSAPSQIVDLTRQKWFFQLAERADYSYAGLRQDDIPQALPGRFVNIESRHHSHVAVPDGGFVVAVDWLRQRYSSAELKKPVIAALPRVVSVEDLRDVRSRLGAFPLRLPVGLCDEDLSPAVLEAYEGEHVLVAGPARSGKSSVLLALAEKLRADVAGVSGDVRLFAVCSSRSPLYVSGVFDRVVSLEEAAQVFVEAETCRVPAVVFIDDAEQYEDSGQNLPALLSPDSGVLVVAAARNDVLRQSYAHWLRKMSVRCRLGVLLVPSVDYDGELLGVTLPRQRDRSFSVARGFLCAAGGSRFIQAMTSFDAIGVGR